MGLVLCSLMIVLSGCMSAETRRLKRIEKHPDIFQAATAEQQSKIRKGQIDIGFTPELVLLSWGKPDYAYDRVTDKRRSRVWKYMAHQSRAAWERTTIPVTYRDDKGQLRTVCRTVTVDRTQFEEYPVAVVEFSDGKVIAFDRQTTESISLDK